MVEMTTGYGLERLRLLGVLGEVRGLRVYRAWDRRRARLVALKLCTPESTAIQQLRLLREARILSGLRESGLPTLIEMGARPGGELPYFTAEFIHGVALDHYVAMRHDLDVLERFALLARVACVVARLHERGLVHRDLKPSNIIVDRSGRPWVIDLGLAQAPGLPYPGLPGFHSAGTPHYMAPEQFAIFHQVDARADVWSLGVMAYKLIAGVFPHPGDSAGEIARAVALRLPTPLRALAPEVPADLEATVMRALERNRHQRPPDAGTWAGEIEHLLAYRETPGLATAVLRRSA